jgi:hypothetical protein
MLKSIFLNIWTIVNRDVIKFKEYFEAEVLQMRSALVLEKTYYFATWWVLVQESQMILDL